MEMHKKEWHETRRKSLGGSDVAPILGLSPWKSAYQLWAEKVGEPTATSEEYAREREWGHRLQDAIIDKVIDGLPDVADVERALRASITTVSGVVMSHEADAILMMDSDGSKVLVEAKTASVYTSTYGWGESPGLSVDGSHMVPEGYLGQVYHGLAVHGAAYGIIAVLIGGSDYRAFRLDRDPEVEAAIASKMEEFWNRYVAPCEPPPITNSRDAIMRWPRHDPGKVVAAEPDILALCRDLANYKTVLSEAEEQVEILEGKIKGAMGDAEALVHPCQKKPIATWRAHVRRDLDREKIKEIHPEVYDSCIKESVIRNFRLSMGVQR